MMTDIITYYDYIDKNLPSMIHFEIRELPNTDPPAHELTARMYNRHVDRDMFVRIAFASPDYTLVTNETYFYHLAQAILKLFGDVYDQERNPQEASSEETVAE